MSFKGYLNKIINLTYNDRIISAMSGAFIKEVLIALNRITN